ncbi:DUF6527 family protein [Paraburkholderia sediminicola]|uniref:DUF6527 family protein n=1 Tax=Paraburkholderia sediminicola TaxID=458836 RepID=UPI0038B706F8
MPKVQEQENEGGSRSLLFDCPGCGFLHAVSVGGTTRPNWTFNEDFEKPTLSPSVAVTWEQGGQSKVCHSFVIEGRIQFLSDCTHALAGQIVPRPDMDDE